MRSKVFKWISALSALSAVGMLIYLTLDIFTRSEFTNTDLTILTVNFVLLAALFKENG
jgi:hypothetical protein